MSVKHVASRAAGQEEITRRHFLAGTLAGGAALCAGGLPSILRAATFGDDFSFAEATIPELQRLLQSGQWTSASLTEKYLRRIERLNPLLHAVIETNPDALEIAASSTWNGGRGERVGRCTACRSW